MLYGIDLDVPKPWLELLQRYQDMGFIDACIAGGALRDLHLGVPIKDLDVWLPDTPSEWPTRLIEGRPKHMKMKLLSHTEFEGFGGSENVRIRQSLIWKVSFSPGIVNEIVTTDAALGAIMRSFDFRVCEIGCNADGFVWATDGYKNDIANKTLTFNPERDWNKCKDHRERLEAKFPTWEVIRPFGTPGAPNGGAPDDVPF